MKSCVVAVAFVLEKAPKFVPLSVKSSTETPASGESLPCRKMLTWLKPRYARIGENEVTLSSRSRKSPSRLKSIDQVVLPMVESYAKAKPAYSP